MSRSILREFLSSSVFSFYDLEDERSVSFFRVHENIDLVHQDVALQTLKAQCQNDADVQRAASAAAASAKALWGFLDGVTAAYLGAEGCAATVNA